MLELSELHHRFGDLVALDSVSLSVGDGEIVGLVGRNGTPVMQLGPPAADWSVSGSESGRIRS